ncbi:Ig-like domain-containing protein [Bacillus sp. AFS017336]|uniref:Ig-like domain-containing protein n=1 Tax=Bacillus sp. AFS017336 TaxID=2033489 RepID=UPI000BF07A13|nr:DUF4350 domain-containing protein [Bacillus sp. AFS017336]PEL12109.1 hypothetical protein CN601_08895 [Bacillus sp. AFS017336]
MHKIMQRYKRYLGLLTTILLLLSTVSPQMAKAAAATTLAKWDFSNGQVTTPSAGIPENMTSNITTTGSKVTGYNAGPSGIPVINANTWSNNSSYWEVSLTTKNYENITLSSKQYSSATGPKDFKLQYSLDENTWVDVPDGSISNGSATWSSGGQLINVALPSEVSDKSSVYLRWIVNSALAAKNDGSNFSTTTGTSRIADIVINGESIGSPTLEKTATPDATKINYSTNSTVTGNAGAVANNSVVKVYYDDNKLAGTTTAAADGSFTTTITNSQSKSVVYVTAQENGKAESDKASVNFSGTIVQKTAAPIATKISFDSYTNVSGSAGAVASNAVVNVYFDDSTIVATTTAAADGSFNVTFANPQMKSVINLVAQEAEKSPSEKTAVNYTGPTENPKVISPGDVAFSQIYVNGGNGGAFYKTKFFELYNNTDKDINLTGWSIAYTSASTMNFGAGQALSGVIKAYGYFLIAGSTGTTGQALPVTPDITTTLNPSGSTGGALVLAKKTTAVTGVDDPDAVDLLAFTNGTAVYKNPLYWGSPISDSTIGGGTIQRKTNIGTDPRSAYGIGNGWFTKDPSKDFVLNKPTSANYSDEMAVHNSKFMLSPDDSKIAYTKANGSSSVTGQAGSVPASSTVKAYFENEGKLTSAGQVTAEADGSFTLSLTDSSDHSVIYLTETDSSQPTPKESYYSRVDVAGNSKSVTSISDLRKNDDKGFPINNGYSTTIEGVATTDNQPNGDVNTNFFIQDSTGAINVINHMNPSTTIQAGNKYSIDGRVVFTAGMTEFIPTAIRFVGNDQTPAAKSITIGELNEATESKLVSFTGKVTNIPTEGPNYDITVSDESGDNLAIVRIQGSLDNIEQGQSYTFTGIVNQYKKAAPFTSGYLLIPRNASDVKGQLVLTHTPITKAYTGMDAAFNAIAKNADSVTLYYKGENEATYHSVNMDTADHINYNGKILEADVPKLKFYYYIEAENAEGKQAVGSSSKPLEVNVVDDQDGPKFYNELPANGDKTDSRHPEIVVKMDDPSGINLSSATISIDGQDKTSIATINDTEIKLNLTTANELAEGEHTILVSAKDKLNNPSTFTWKFTVTERFTGGNHYRGTTHNHTNISHDAAGSPEEALKAAEKYHYDFFAFSDHSHDIDADLVNKDTVDRKGFKERTGGANWQLTKDLAKQYTKDGKFVVFPAFEMTSTTWGHSNVFGTENFIDRVVDGGAYQNLQKYYGWVLTYDNIIAQFNHPKMSANAFDNFIPYNKNLDKLFTMLEVGNGSGKYSYANAEDSYYSALDIGWHVAPTYGEDNHDATWGQTKKRTVIVAKDLSQDALLDAMKNRRVYMTEDPNFSLDVSASGFYMGSTVDTDTLDFNISGKDPVLEQASDSDYSYIKTASNDAIAKVELITNHGTVVDKYVPTNDSTSFNWKPSFTVVGGQQWFVVKVTQKDGDQVYSAPIWSQQKDLAVKVSDVTTKDGAIIGGLSADLTAGISNQGTLDVKQVTAHFYYDSIDANHFIADASIDSLPSNTSASASVTWTNPVPGTHKIIVVLTAADGHDLGNNKYEQSFTIKAPLNKVVMIDGSHNNENSKQDTGTYKDNFKLFTTLMKQQGYTVAENASPLTEQVLKNVSVLVITHPASAYSASEISDINNFVKNGGSLLLTEKSNFGATNQNVNSILSGVGSSILVNNDGVFDETTDGNFWGTPLTANYAVRLHPTPNKKTTLTDFVPTIEFYSGSSLAKNDGSGNKVALTDSDTVTVLAKGNESTFQDTTTIKPDTVKYNVQTSNGKNGPPLDQVTGGSSIPIIASEQVGNGRVFVSGMNIFNDKQMDQTYNPKGNDPFAVNVVNWLSQINPEVKSMGDARKLTEGTNVVVEGTVTATSFFDAAYIQDSTGGIMAFNDVPAGSLEVGDKVRVYGHIKIFENNFELEFGSFAESIVKLGKGTPIEAKVVSTKDSNIDENQGQLVKVIGKVVSKYDDNSYVIDDGSGPTLVFTDGYVVNQSGPVPNLNIGDTLEATGLAGKFSEGNRIRVRDTKELVGTHTAKPKAPVVNALSDQDEKITGTTEAGTKVIAKVNDKEIANAIADNSDNFEMKITKQVAGTKIVVTAVDSANNESDGVEVIVSDKTAPNAPVVNEVQDNSTTVTGKAEVGSTITVSKGSVILGQAVTNQEGNFSVLLSSKQTAGTKLSVVSTDNAGNESSATEVIVVDKTAPIKPVVNGISDKDEKITGTTEAGAKVIAKVNGKEIANAIADNSGNFEMKISRQVVGTKVVVTAVDSANNVSDGVEVIVSDKTAPNAPVVNQVQDNSTAVTGKAEPGTTISVSKGSVVLGQSVTKQDGSFSVSLSSKQPAGTKLSVVSTDNAGNKSPVTEVIVVDKTAPMKPVVNLVKDTDTHVTGTAEVGSTIFVSVGNKVLGSVKTNSKGSFDVLITKQKAGTVLTVVSVDSAGNKSSQVQVTVADKTPPVKPVVNAVKDSDTKVSGKGEAGSTIKVSVAKTLVGQGTADKAGIFSITLKSKLKAGTVLSVVSIDKAGNSSSIVQVKVIDKTPPKAPSVNSVTDKTKSITGTAEAGSKVIVKSGSTKLGEATANSSGKFTITIKSYLKVGTTLTITATDKSGNTSPVTKVKVKKPVSNSFSQSVVKWIASIHF